MTLRRTLHPARGWFAAAMLLLLGCGCRSVPGAKSPAADRPEDSPAADLLRRLAPHSPITVHSDNLMPATATVTIRARPGESPQLSLSRAPGWQAAVAPLAADPECLLVRLRESDAPAPRTLELLVHCPAADSSGAPPTPRLLVLSQLVDERLVTQSLAGQVSFGGGESTPLDPLSLAVWARDHPEQLVDTDLIMRLSDTLWHNQHLDRPPGSYNDIIALHYRLLELDPAHTDVYTTTAWLLWSKWVSWRTRPESMPDGEHKLREALELLQRGARKTAGDPRYPYEAGMTLLPVARFHRPELMPTVMEYLMTAYRLEKEPQRQVRIRLDIAHRHRQAGQEEDAIAWYRKVLEVAPEHPVARQYLDQLGAVAAPR